MEQNVFKKIDSVNEAMTLINYPVVKKEIFYDANTQNSLSTGFTQAKAFKGLVREDSGEILSVVSNKYRLIQNVDAFAVPLAHLTEKEDFTANRVSIFNSGAKVSVDLLSKDNYQIPGNEKETYKKRIILFNSFDKSSALTIVFGAFRLICKNGAGIWVKESKSSIRAIHSGADIPADATRKYITTALLQFNEQFNEYMQNLRILESKQIDDARKELQALMLGKYMVEKLAQRVENAYVSENHNKVTLLMLLNAYTEYISDLEEKKQKIDIEYIKMTQRFMSRLMYRSTFG